MPPAVVETVTSLALAIDAKDHYTQGHSQKVSAYAVMIAQALGMNEAEVEEIRLAALLHDIGKVGIPEIILNKSGPLDANEWDTMKTHTELGAKILEPLQPMSAYPLDGTASSRVFRWLRLSRPPRRRTHSVGARVIAIADAYDTITSERTYKKRAAPKKLSPSSNAAPQINSIPKSSASSSKPCAAPRSNHRAAVGASDTEDMGSQA